MANRIMLNQTSYHGAGAIQELPAEVKSRGLKKALICCGPTLLRHGVIARVTDVLDAALAAQRGVGPVFRLMGRTVKNALRKRKESAR